MDCSEMAMVHRNDPILTNEELRMVGYHLRSINGVQQTLRANTGLYSI